MRKKKMALAAQVAASAFLLLVTATAASALTVDEAKQNGVRLGFPNEPPNTFVGDNGKVTGAYNEFVIAVLKKMGITKVQGVVMDFGSLIPGLQANRLDIIPAIFIRPARCQLVAFSEPLERGGTAFLVAKGNPMNIHSYDDVVKGTAIVGVMSGAVEEGYAKKAGIPEDRILPLGDQASLLEALKTGRANAIILTPSSIDSMAANSGGAAERAEPFSSPRFANSYGAIAFRKDDAAFVAAFNAAMKEFMQTPEFWDVMKPVGYSKDSLPGDMTTTEQCSMPAN
jgi:polar amino acid transport system substrate-binding protein